MWAGPDARSFPFNPHPCLSHPITLWDAGLRWQLSAFQSSWISNGSPGCTIWQLQSAWLLPTSRHTLISKQRKKGRLISAAAACLILSLWLFPSEEQEVQMCEWKVKSCLGGLKGKKQWVLLRNKQPDRRIWWLTFVFGDNIPSLAEWEELQQSDFTFT